MFELLPNVPESPENIDKNTYLNFLNNPQIGRVTDTDQKKEIAIIGGGISGLIAGWLLKRAGHSIKIFEASNRVGGRIKTIRESFSGSIYAEAGAMRIPEDHTLTLQLLQFLNLPISEFNNNAEGGLFYANGKQTKYKNHSANEVDYELLDHESGIDADTLFNRIIDTHVQSLGGFNPKTFDAHTEHGRKIFEFFDRMSIRELLYGHPEINESGDSLSHAGADMICTALSLEMHLQSSVTAILSDHIELNHTEKYYKIKGGMDNLSRSFVGDHIYSYEFENLESFKNPNPPLTAGNNPDLKHDIVYNARVTNLEFKNSREDGKKSIFLQYYNTMTRREIPEQKFDLVISSLPFSSFRSIRTQAGLLSREKRRAIRQLHYDNSCKIFLEFDEHFWMKQPFNINGGKSVTDLQIRQVYYPTLHDASLIDTNSLVLASYTWGDESLRWTSLNEVDRIKFALRDLEIIHQIDLEEKLVGGASHSWSEDQFSAGAFAMFAPYQKTSLFDDIWSPEHRIHFCGEHTSTKHAWIEGALESGVRVAREVCGRIANDPDLNPDWPN